MKLLFFDDFKFGAVKGADQVVDLTDAVKDIAAGSPQDLLRGVIANWASLKPKLEAAVASGQGKPLSSVRIRPPVPKPSNVDCMAVNYMENGTRAAPAPIDTFHKSPLSIIGNGDTMVLPDVPATIFEGEAELAMVFSKGGQDIPESDAMGYIFGWLNFIDGSARGLGPPSNGFYRGKSRSTFCPIGPFLVTADEVPNPQNLHVQLWNSGKLCQDYNSNDMAHNIQKSIAWVTSNHPVEAGDILALGTNHRGLNPFQDGDKIEIETEGLGRLTINVRDDLKRTWKRETRLERAEQGLEGATAQLTGKHTKEPAKA